MCRADFPGLSSNDPGFTSHSFTIPALLQSRCRALHKEPGYSRGKSSTVCCWPVLRSFNIDLSVYFDPTINTLTTRTTKPRDYPWRENCTLNFGFAGRIHSMRTSAWQGKSIGCLSTGTVGDKLADWPAATTTPFHLGLQQKLSG